MEHLSRSDLAATFIDLKSEESWRETVTTEFIPTIREKCIGNGKIIMGNKTGRCFERNGGNSLCVLLWDEPQIQREEFDSLFWVLFKKDGLRGFESSKNVII